MRNAIFTIIENLARFNEKLTQVTLNSLIRFIAWFGNTYIAVCHTVVSFILNIVNPDRADHKQKVNEQADKLGELEILFEISNVKRNVMTRGTWRNEDALEFNRLGSALAFEHQWSTIRVNNYLGQILTELQSQKLLAESDDEDLIDPPDTY